MRQLPSRYNIRFAEPDDAPKIMKDLRSFEKRSVQMVNMNPVFQLQSEIKQSQYCFAGTVDDKVGVIWGIKQPTLLSGTGHLWAITTTLVDEHPFVFLRHSREFIKMVQQQYESLEGYVLHDYERSKKWLTWLGFKIGPPQRFEKLSVCKFERRRA